jgi:hypothetical protein
MPEVLPSAALASCVLVTVKTATAAASVTVRRIPERVGRQHRTLARA